MLSLLISQSLSSNHMAGQLFFSNHHKVSIQREQNEWLCQKLEPKAKIHSLFHINLQFSFLFRNENNAICALEGLYVW